MFTSLVFAGALCPAAEAQAGAANGAAPFFTPGNLVVVVEGCGVNGGTCTSVPNGTGTGTGNSSAGGYGDNQGAPLTLFQYTPTGTTSAMFVNSLVLPQTASGANLPLAGEYGSSSEGALSLSNAGQYLTFMGYGINPATFDATPTTYGAAPSLALAQSGSLTGQSYTPIPRVVVTVDANGNVNSSTAVYNVFDNNNPRSVYTLDGLNAWISGQGNSPDKTGGVFYTPLGAVNNAPVAITGADTNLSTTPSNQDTRNVQVYNGTLYVSVDSTEGSGSNRAFIGTLGNPPATSLYQSGAGPTQISEANTAGKSVSAPGKITLTAPETNGINTTGEVVNLSPSGFFFASPTVLYVADSGQPKNTSSGTTTGAGGLQKWVLVNGTWVFEYAISAGLNLVANTSSSGTTGLYALTGVVSGSNVFLYATNYTVGDLDQRYLYGFTDVLAATTQPAGSAASFTVLATAPPDSNFKGVSFAPQYPATTASATLTTTPSGLTITTQGTGCVPGTYVTPVTLEWTPGSVCTLTTTAMQANGTVAETFVQWQDNTAATTDSVIAAAAGADTTYTALFEPTGAVTLAVGSPTVVLGASTTLTAQVSFTGSTAPSVPASLFTVNGSTTGVGTAICTGTASPLTCTATYSTSSLTAAGTYPITAALKYPNVNVSPSGSGTLTVTAATDFSFAASSSGSTVIVSPGSAASISFALGATQGSYPGTVTFSVSGLPSGVTGAFSPATVAANSPSQTVTLTLTASSSVAAAEKHTRIEYGSIAVLTAMLLPLCFRRRLRAGGMQLLVVVPFLVASAAMLIGIIGCNNGSSAKSSTASPFTVTATSGSVTHTVTATIVVNP